MKASGTKGRLVLVSSTMALTGFAGYASYGPGKHALRGLADCLRNELLPHGIQVHVAFPGTMDTPGLAIEERTKPTLTKLIEGSDQAQSPGSVAHDIMLGISREQAYITTDWTTDVLRCLTNGTEASKASGQWELGIAPRRSPWYDSLVMNLASVVFVPWRWYVDWLVVGSFRKMPLEEE